MRQQAETQPSDAHVPMEVEWFARTDLGGRTNNEDAFLVCALGTGDTALPRGGRRTRLSSPGLLVMVSDGMGGAVGGEVASQLAVSSIKEYLLTHRAELNALSPRPGERPSQEVVLEQAFTEANELVRREAEQRQLTGMGATATAALFLERNCYLAHVGDSRAYRVAGGKIEQLTEDHSLVAELERMGQLTPQQARVHPRRSVLTQSLGAVPTLKVQTRTVALAEGDLLLFCSDGLTSVLTDTKLLHAALESGGVRGICHQLVAMAKDEHTDDNVTVAVCLAQRAASGAVRTGDAAPAAAVGRREEELAQPAWRTYLWLLVMWAIGLVTGLVVMEHPREPRFPFVVRLDGEKAVVIETRMGWFGHRTDHVVPDLSLKRDDIASGTLPAVEKGVGFAGQDQAKHYLSQIRRPSPKPKVVPKPAKPKAPAQVKPEEKQTTRAISPQAGRQELLGKAAPAKKPEAGAAKKETDGNEG